MGRLLYIGIIAFMAIGFAFCTFLLNRGLRNTFVNGKRFIDEPVNENTGTDKMTIGEILVYVLMFVIAILFIVQIIYQGAKYPSATAILIRTILLVPIMSLFNARRRTGRAMVVLFGSLLFVLFCIMTYIIIGVPQKAPVLTMYNTEIKLGETTIGELMENGFDFYMETENSTMWDLRNFHESEVFKKYFDTMDLSIPKGYHRHSMEKAPYSEGILVKNDMPIAEVTLHGSMTKEMPLKDCSIIYLYIREIYMPTVRKDETAIKLNGIDLLTEIETNTLKKTFGRKLIRPSQIEADKYFIVSWNSNSDHLFFNSYAANIHMDDNRLTESIELECQIAREAD